MKRLLPAVLLLAVLAAPCAVRAFQVRVTTDEFILRPSESYAEELALTARTADLGGRMDDDLFLLASEKAALSGDFRRDVWVLAPRLQFTGRATDHVRLAGESVECDGAVGRNLTAAGNTVKLAERSRVDGSVRIVADQAILLGQVGGRVRVQARRIVLGGQFGGDVDIVSGEPVFLPGTRIAGNLFHTGAHDLVLGAGVELAGQQSRRVEPETDTLARRFAVSSLMYLAMMFAGLPVLLIFPRPMERVLHQLRTRFVVCGAVGSAALMVLPFAAVFAASTVPGLLLALLMLAFLVTGLFAGAVAAGVRLGHVLRMRGPSGGPVERVMALSFGLIVLNLLGLVPALRVWVILPLFVFGFGAVILALATPRTMPPPPVPAGPPAGEDGPS